MELNFKINKVDLDKEFDERLFNKIEYNKKNKIPLPIAILIIGFINLFICFEFVMFYNKQNNKNNDLYSKMSQIDNLNYE